MEDAENLGGCPWQDNVSPRSGVSPIINNVRESTKTFTRCPICDGALKFGSRDPCEGDFYWCENCGDGPICFPLYEKPAPRIAPIIDVEELQRVLRSIREVPVPGYIPPTPHSFLDPILSDAKLDRAKERVIVDIKLAGGEEI